MKRFLVLLVTVAAALPLAAQPFGAATSEFRVNTYTTATAGAPDAAYIETSGFVIAWNGNETTDPFYGVFAQRYGTVLPVEAQFRVNTYVSYQQAGPRIVGAPAGSASVNQFVVVWTSQNEDGAGGGAFGQRYGSSGPLGDEFRVNTYTPGDEASPDVALDANGDFVVVWEQPDADGRGVFGRRYASTGAPQGDAFRVNVITTSDQRFPSVAMSSSGDFVVVWESYGGFGSYHNVVGRRFSSTGAPVTDDFVIPATSSSDHNNPSVADLGAHGYVVTWQSVPTGGGGAQIFARRFDVSGAPSTGAFRVNTSTTFGHLPPSVGGGSQGAFTIVWDYDDGDDEGVYGQRYAVTGAPVGGEFRINAYTTGFQVGPRLAMGSNGAFIVTWQSTGQFAGPNIYARSFCPLQGDADGSNTIDVADIFYLINNLFAGGPAPAHGADVNGDGNTDIADVFYLINYLFAGGPAPVCVAT